MEVSAPFVILMGMGVTFAGLICLIVLVTLMGRLLAPRGKKEQARPAPEKNAELIAAVSAVLAEEMGTDVTALRIVSMKRL